MNILTAFFSLAMLPAMRKFHRDVADPAAAQRARLCDILHANAHTEFGRAHAFSTIHDFAAFRAALPIRTYDDFAPYIKRMAAGHSDVLVGQPLEMFATTSGTAGEPKRCPVTRRFTLEHHRQHKLWMRHLTADHPELLRGGLLSIVSPEHEGLTSGGIPYGSSSGKQYHNQAWPVRRKHAVPYAVSLIADYQARYHALLVFALAADLSIVTSVNPSTLVLLANLLRDRAEPLLDDLQHGTLQHAGTVSEAELRCLQPYLKPQPHRAAQLRECLCADGVLLPKTAWKNIVVTNTWQGGSAPFYLRQLDDLWGEMPRRCLGLRASEGTFSIPLRDHDPAGVLAVGGHVMEFLPEDTTPTEDAKTLLAHELTVGERYRLIITTSGGFYRYDLADIIEVTGLHAQTPEIVFLHKAGNVLSVTGEKVTEDQVVAVMREVGSAVHDIAGFTVTHELIQPPRLLLAVELSEATAASLAPERLADILTRFENGLAGMNDEYREKRASGRLAAPRLVVLKPGSYARHRAALVAAGRPDGQIKPPHLIRPAGEGTQPIAECPFFAAVEIIGEGRLPSPR